MLPQSKVIQARQYTDVHNTQLVRGRKNVVCIDVQGLSNTRLAPTKRSYTSRDWSLRVRGKALRMRPGAGSREPYRCEACAARRTSRRCPCRPAWCGAAAGARAGTAPPPRRSARAAASRRRARWRCTPRRAPPPPRPAAPPGRTPRAPRRPRRPRAPRPRRTQPARRPPARSPRARPAARRGAARAGRARRGRRGGAASRAAGRRARTGRRARAGTRRACRAPGARRRSSASARRKPDAAAPLRTTPGLSTRPGRLVLASTGPRALVIRARHYRHYVQLYATLSHYCEVRLASGESTGRARPGFLRATNYTIRETTLTMREACHDYSILWTYERCRLLATHT